MILQLLLVVVAVVLTSALCSLFEAVLYAVPISHIETLARGGRRTGRVLRRLRADVDKPIAAILSLNTIANTAGAAIAGALAAAVMEPRWLAYFSAALTLAILLFSEVIPKTTGVVYCRPLARFVAYPVQWLVWAFMPIIWMLQLVTRVISKRQKDHRVSDEELMTLVRLGSRTGDFKAHEASVIQNVLSLESKTARDIMTPRTVVHSFDAQATVGDLQSDKEFLQFSRLPVYAKDLEDVVGIVHRREVLNALAESRTDVKVEELMHPVDFALESTSLDQLLQEFLERRQHMVIVIDEYGGLAGLVTLEDVIEEILGAEIVDEFDRVADLRQVAARRREETLKRNLPSRGSAASRGEPSQGKPKGGSRKDARKS